MSEMIIKLKQNHVKIKGCEYVQDLVRCGECKHKPIKEDVNGENYGFNLIEPTEGDKRCPCLVSDGWYSWMPDDNFYCKFGERKESE